MVLGPCQLCSANTLAQNDNRHSTANQHTQHTGTDSEANGLTSSARNYMPGASCPVWHTRRAHQYEQQIISRLRCWPGVLQSAKCDSQDAKRPPWECLNVGVLASWCWWQIQLLTAQHADAAHPSTRMRDPANKQRRKLFPQQTIHQEHAQPDSTHMFDTKGNHAASMAHQAKSMCLQAYILMGLTMHG